jgi:hypothetical protein
LLQPGKTSSHELLITLPEAVPDAPALDLVISNPQQCRGRGRAQSLVIHKQLVIDRKEAIPIRSL